LNTNVIVSGIDKKHCLDILLIFLLKFLRPFDLKELIKRFLHVAIASRIFAIGLLKNRELAEQKRRRDYLYILPFL
jgi:hypothetical protein